MIKTIAESIVFLCTLACIMVPFLVWVSNPNLTQMQVFLNTWIWIFYGFIIYIIGITTVKGLFDNNEP